MQLQDLKPEKILVVKLSAIGDTVHAVPAVTALKDRFPSAEISWCVEKRCAPLVRCLECIDRVIVLNTRKWRRGRHWGGDEGLPSILGELRRTHFDLAIDFQGLLKSALVTRFSGASARIGWSRKYLREPLAAGFYTRCVDGIPDGSHVIEWCSALLGPLGINEVPRRFPYRFPPETRTRVDRILADNIRKPFVILNPGGGWPTKRWDPERFGQLSRRIAEELDLETVLTYGPGEDELAAIVCRAAPNTVSLRLDLLELAVLSGSCACFVGGDTGPMHIASAMGAPVVALFGPTLASRNGPFHPADISLSLDLPCAGSYRRECPDCRCMDFPVEDVFAAVVKRISSGEQST